MLSHCKTWNAAKSMYKGDSCRLVGNIYNICFLSNMEKKINCEILGDINWGEKMCVKSVKWSEKWMTPTMTSKYLGDVNS